jgi:hypothetical protein
MYLEHDGSKDWFVRRINDHHITDYGSGEVITAAERTKIGQSGLHFHKYFDPEDSNQTTDASAFRPGDGYHRYSFVKGDGSEWHDDASITPEITKVCFPTAPVDGALFELHSNLHRSTTVSSQVLTLVWPGPDSSNIPSGRYLVVDGVRKEINEPTNYTCAASSAHSKRDYYRFNDNGLAGFWSRFVDTN